VLGDCPLVAFLPTTDFARARDFYERTLGLALTAEEHFALVYHLGGTMLRVTRVEQLDPQPFTVLGWQVGDIEAEARDLASRGVVFERYAGLDQDALGIWSAPSGSRIAWFKDPDGNVLSIGQH